MTFRCVAALRDCSLQSSRVGVLMAILSSENWEGGNLRQGLLSLRKGRLSLMQGCVGMRDLALSSVTYWIALLL